ncbi:hypothetical protein PLESTF_000316700 [Pleodorina starrii]|nr:hypothetical protein PLESTF_000316700 [Pleodorina starrii]
MTRIGNLTYPRWYPTATLLPNGMVTIMGGSTKPSGASPKNPIYEIWDPASPTQQQLFRNQTEDMFTNTSYIFYPNTYVLPTGDLFMVLKAYGEITKPMTGVRRTATCGEVANTTAKSYGDFVEPLTDELIKLFKYLLAGDDGEPYRADCKAFTKWVNSALKRLFKNPHVSLNSLRHARATWSMVNNFTVAEQKAEARLMGHSHEMHSLYKKRQHSHT